jgi:CubicO group peptidase (beta-lactamase class C family)
MLRFDQALRHDRLLPKTWTDWIYSNTPGAPPNSPDASARSGALSIAGGTPGASTAMDMNLDTGTTVIVFTNMDPQTAERALKRLRQWLPKPGSVRGGEVRAEEQRCGGARRSQLRDFLCSSLLRSSATSPGVGSRAQKFAAPRPPEPGGWRSR